MTPETPTPETDVFILAHSGFGPTDYEWRLHARRLERERDATRQAMAEAASHLSGFLGFHADGLSLDQVRALSATLDKLKPSIPDASAPNA